MEKSCATCVFNSNCECIVGPYCFSFNHWQPKQNAKSMPLFTPQDLLQASAVIFSGILSDPSVIDVDLSICYKRVKELAKLIEEDFNK